jgi:hypothetical protein
VQLLEKNTMESHCDHNNQLLTHIKVQASKLCHFLDYIIPQNLHKTLFLVIEMSSKRSATPNLNEISLSMPITLGALPGSQPNRLA